MSSPSRPKRAIIIAAGMGQRLRPYTNEVPKCMVEVAGSPMLLRTMKCMRNVGVEEFIIIRGYKAEVFDKLDLGKGVTFVDNVDYEKNNILLSFFKAQQYFENQESFYFSYADIIFAQDVMDKLADASGDFCLIVDKEYAKIYEGRTDHPLSQAELCTVDAEGFVKKVGKCSCPYDEAVGEFIGLAKVTGNGVKQLVDTYRELQKEYEGTTNKPFVRAASWAQTYVCDMLEYLVEQKKAKMVPVLIEGKWREIDTVQDKNNADKTVDW